MPRRFARLPQERLLRTGRLERGLDIHYLLEPNPKAARVRFVVRVSATGRIGTADVDLTKPPPSASSALVPPPTAETAH